MAYCSNIEERVVMVEPKKCFLCIPDYFRGGGLARSFSAQFLADQINRVLGHHPVSDPFAAGIFDAVGHNFA
jgi:hypothetical protein